MSTMSYADKDKNNFLHGFTNMRIHEEKGPMFIERGEGIYVYDDANNKYLDGVAGLWNVSLGFSNERLVRAAEKQLRLMPAYHTFNHRSTKVAAELCETLIEMIPVPMSKVYLANSGSEANDTAAKMAWYYFHGLGRPEKKKVISIKMSYHGSTIFAGGLTGQDYMYGGFNLPSPGILHTDSHHYYRFSNPGETEEQFCDRVVKSLEALILKEGPDTIAAMFAEPIQGSGGVRVPVKGYFERVQALLKKHDILFIADEVVCGFCRTGNMFGIETMNLVPDMMVFAKGFSSAYQPIAAVTVSPKVYDVLKRECEKHASFSHGYTTSGHPVACAVALETMKVYLEENIVDHVRDVGAYFQQELQQFAGHPLIGEVRGKGLLAGLEIDKTLVFDDPIGTPYYAARHIAGIMESLGLFTRALQCTLVFCPPLIITKKECAEMISLIGKSIEEGYKVLKGCRSNPSGAGKSD